MRAAGDGGSVNSQAVQAFVRQAIGYIEQTPDKPTRVELIKTLQVLWLAQALRKLRGASFTIIVVAGRKPFAPVTGLTSLLLRPATSSVSVCR